jgi:glutaminyl-peptide cyclotransferase
MERQSNLSPTFSMRTFLIYILFQSVITVGCISPAKKDKENADQQPATAIPKINYVVKKNYPHDTTSFTEGFLFHNGLLYESTGASPGMPQTRSLFGVVNLSTGLINKKAELDGTTYFGEGITFLKDKLYQLTYQTKIGFIYDTLNFKNTGQFTFPSDEGWGLTTDGELLIMSDGTNTITYLSTDSFEIIRQLKVTDENGPVNNINELEFINGFIYANVFTTNSIIKINPTTGNVVGKLHLESLASEAKLIYSGSMEMNGIAFNKETNSVFITGKMWPVIYEITFPF